MDFTKNKVSQITESKAQQGTSQKLLQRGDLCHDTQRVRTLSRKMPWVQEDRYLFSC